MTDPLNGLRAAADELHARYGDLLARPAETVDTEVLGALTDAQDRVVGRRERAIRQAQQMVDTGQMNLLEATFYADSLMDGDAAH